MSILQDWTAIEAWVKEYHPECEFVCVTLEDTELAKKIGHYNEKKQQPYFGNDEFMYAVIPPDGTTFPEHFAIAAELYEQFGIEAEWLCPESASTPQNHSTEKINQQIGSHMTSFFFHRAFSCAFLLCSSAIS